MIKNKKPGLRPFETTGYVEHLNGSNNTVKIITSGRHERRTGWRIEMDIEQVKQFIPYLYKNVKVQFVKGCLFITDFD